MAGKRNNKKQKRLKDKVKVKSNNEKQYNITLKGYEKAKAEAKGIAGIKATRLGIKYSVVKHKDPKVLELESNIAYYENKIHEKQLEIKAFYDELKILEKELAEFNSYERLKEKELIQKQALENNEIVPLTEDMLDDIKAILN